eukprot:858428-Pleurochrysis_carterae.AAC.1
MTAMAMRMTTPARAPTAFRSIPAIDTRQMHFRFLSCMVAVTKPASHMRHDALKMHAVDVDMRIPLLVPIFFAASTQRRPSSSSSPY